MNEGITSIPAYVFSECTKPTYVTISDIVTRIDSYAFNKCSSLTSLNIPISVNSVITKAFKGCTSLTVLIPKYTLYEKDFINSNIKYNYSNESVFLVEQMDAYATEKGIVYYRVTNNTTTTYYNFNVGCLLIDSTSDQVGGESTR